jgi:hypothetical protein
MASNYKYIPYIPPADGTPAPAALPPKAPNPNDVVPAPTPPQSSNYTYKPYIEPTPETAPKLGNETTKTDASAQELPEMTVTNKAPDEPVMVNLPNPLHEYPSYTYSLSLHLLSAESWNQVQETGKYTATDVLIASAGRWDNFSFIRNQNFLEDFFIESLTMTTIIGLTSSNPGSNAIDFKFTIIEPYGVTLLDRIIAANNELPTPQQNYLDSTYLIQIDFYGSNDLGEIVHPIPNLTKYLPIRILGIDITVTSAGSEYAVSAVPYGHSAHTQTTQQTPANFEVTADIISDFFTSTVESTAQTNTATGRESPTSSSASKPTSDKIKSYANALNDWQLQLKLNNDQAEADIYDFVFDDVIGNAKITESGKLPPKNTEMATQAQAGAIAKASLAGTNNAAAINFNIRTYAINAGTSIESVLTTTIKNSSYITSQINNPANFNGDLSKYLEAKKAISKEPFRWFKIIPKVTLLKYDSIRKVYARKIVYYVKTYIVKNVKVDFGPGAIATQPIKVYDYIYTGNNTDIISLDLKFNSAVYTSITNNPNKGILGTGAADQTGSAEKVNDSEANAAANAITPIRIIPSVGNQQNIATGAALTGDATLSADMVQSQLSSAGGDMLEVDLKIVGDPLFIKQDDIFFPPTVNNSQDSDTLLTENNSIKTDYGEIYTQLTVNTPVDRDGATGMMKYDQKFPKSSFSGMYKVLKVESEFSRGVFTQTLNMIRQPKQPKMDYINGGTSDSADIQRNSDLGLPSVPLQSILPVDNNFSMLNILNKAIGTASDAIPQLSQTMQSLTSPLSTIEQLQQIKLSDVSLNALTVPISTQNAPSLVPIYKQSQINQVLPG